MAGLSDWGVDSRKAAADPAAGHGGSTSRQHRPVQPYTGAHDLIRRFQALLRSDSQAYQIGASAVVKLPPFQLPGAAAVSADSIGLVALYGRVYCWLHDRSGKRITMHRFYK